MNDRPASGPRSPDPFPALRIVALIAAILGVLVLAAAAFVLSYPGIHQLARTAGMSVSLARVFPVIFDALLVVAIAAVLSLHGAGWFRRGYSWLIMLLLLAAMAAGGVLHAVHPDIPHRPAEVTAAVLPWALLLIALSLLLSMLRQFRQARLSAAAQPASQPATGQPATGQPATGQPATGQPATGQTAPAPGSRTGLDEILSPGGTRIVPAQPSRLSTSPAQTPASDSQTPGAPARADTKAADPARADTKAADPARADTKAADPARADTKATGPTRADAQPGDADHTAAKPTDRTAPKPADLTTPTGTGWGSRSYPDTGAASNGSADTTPAANSAADQPAEGDGRSQAKPADAASTMSGPTDSSPDGTSPDGTSPDGPADRAEDETAGPGELPASAGTIHVPHQPMRAPVPAPSPHFDRLRSTPTPPEDDTDPDA